ncbi:hypothetical protein KI387_009054, partial [Taxus chinensis]
MVYLIEDEEIENLDVDHTEGTHDVLDNVDEKARTYHEPLKMKKVNIGTEAKERHLQSLRSAKRVLMEGGRKGKCLPLAIVLFLCSLILQKTLAFNSGLCNITECVKGSCNDTMANPLDILPRCQCDTGWSQPSIENITLSFLPCVIPNCTLDTSCSKTGSAAAPPPLGVPPPVNLPPCAPTLCGEGGSCKPTSNFSYVCNCEKGYENLLNFSSGPCVTQCSFGVDCTQLGIGLGGGGSTTPPPTQVNNNK